jgi:hypothetical protein
MIDSFFNLVEIYVYPIFLVILISSGIGAAASPTLKSALEALTFY